jgi:hypothetical protein
VKRWKKNKRPCNLNRNALLTPINKHLAELHIIRLLITLKHSCITPISLSPTAKKKRLPSRELKSKKAEKDSYPNSEN